MASATGSMGSIEVYNNGSGNDAFMAFHTGSDFACYFGLDADANDLAVGGWSMGANKYKVLHLGNIDDALTSTAVEVGTGFAVGKGTSTSSFMQIGQSATGSNYAYIDLVGDTTYTDYGLRLIRGNGGANATSSLVHRGTNQLNITASDAGSITLNTSNTTALTIASNHDATFTGTVSDSKGNLRSIPKTAKSATYAIVAADAGTCLATNSQITVQGSQMSEGDAVTILNNSGSSINIVRSSFSLFNTGNGNDEDTSLGARGIATIYFLDAGNGYISGSSLGS